ncbi:MAG: flavodoxin family protein [Brevinema sp.]
MSGLKVSLSLFLCKKMKILTIFGSPRSQGYTRMLLDEVLSHISGEIIEVDAYQMLKKGINPCLACGFCRKILQCSISDEMQSIYSYINEADVVIFASPVYFYGVPAPLKMIIDRLQPYWEQGQRENITPSKKGAILLTGGAKGFPKQFSPAEISLKQALKDIGASYFGGIFLAGTDFYLSPHLPSTIKLQATELSQKLLKNERI